jgi:hypothetical protein
MQVDAILPRFHHADAEKSAKVIGTRGDDNFVNRKLENLNVFVVVFDDTVVDDGRGRGILWWNVRRRRRRRGDAFDEVVQGRRSGGVSFVYDVVYDVVVVGGRSYSDSKVAKRSLLEEILHAGEKRSTVVWSPTNFHGGGGRRR